MGTAFGRQSATRFCSDAVGITGLETQTLPKTPAAWLTPGRAQEGANVACMTAQAWTQECKVHRIPMEEDSNLPSLGGALPPRIGRKGNACGH